LGARVRAFARPTSDVTRLARPGVELFRGDLLEPDRLRAACDGARFIFHLAEVALRVRDAGERNAAAVRVLAEAARRPGFGRLVYASAVFVNSVPLRRPAEEDTPADPRRTMDDAITRWKRRSEAILRGAGVPATAVRPAGVYGPGAEYLVSWMRALSRPLPFPARMNALTATVHVDDVAAAMIAVARKSGDGFRAVQVVDDAVGTYREFFGTLAREAGLRIRAFRPPYALQVAGARLLDPLLALRVPGRNVLSAVWFMDADQQYANRRLKDEFGVALRHPTWATGLPATGRWIGRRLRERAARGS
jgi:nucleoside-diphosphate-sugar epimerase